MENNNQTIEQLLDRINKIEKKAEETNKLKKELISINQQLEANNQQLLASEQQLRAANQQLEASNQQIVASEQRFRTYFEQGLIGMAITSVEKGWVEFNDVICNMLGYSQKELLNMTWEELTHPDDLETDLFQFNKMLAGEIDVYTMEKRFVHKSGNIVYTVMSINAYRKPHSNKVENVLAILHDISEKKQTEIALLESEEKYRILTETAPFAIMVYQNDKWIYSNTATSNICGYSASELKNMQVWEFIAPEYKELIKELSQKRQLGEEPMTNYEFKIITKSGIEKWVFLSGNTIKIGNEYAGMITVVDISRQKKTELELKKLSTAITQSPSIVQITDLEGNIEYVNPKFTELTGYSFKEVEGLNVEILESGELTSKDNKELWDTISSGKEWRGEFLNKKKNGELLWLWVISVIHRYSRS